VVFPECAVSGYCFASREEARAAAEPVPGPVTALLEAACAARNCVVVVGLVETQGEALYNSALVVGPRGLIGCYRKSHLPWLGLDRFVQRGDGPLEPFDTPAGRLGVGICYDGSFPEVSRTLKLRGAQLIALPTNWPEGAEVSAEHHAATRAHENHLFFLAVNRIGTERGVRFIGRSRIVDCHGRTLAAAAGDEPALLLAEIEPASADRNRVVIRPGEYELDRVADRRPQLYGALVEPVAGEGPNSGHTPKPNCPVSKPAGSL
jgi:predicted amidohydrolase